MSARWCLLASLLAIAPSLAAAQSTVSDPQVPSTETIETLILSGDPRLVAWGAHYSIESKDDVLISDLLSVASNWRLTQKRNPADERDAMGAVLDALVLMNASVPANVLRHLATEFPNYVAILLSRLPPSESQPLSFELYRFSKHSSLQYVAGELLANHPVEGFAADLFSSIHVRATVFVVDPERGVGGGVGGSILCGCGGAVTHKGWPTLGSYKLSKQAEPKSFLVVAGIDPIYATRHESAHAEGDSCPRIFLGPEERRRLLAQVLHIDPQYLGWETTVSENIRFTSPEQFYSALDRFIFSQRAKIEGTSVALVAANLMTRAEQKQSLPELELHVVDERAAGGSDITEPAILPPHVTWIGPWR